MTSAVHILCKCGHDSDLHALEDMKFGDRAKLGGWGMEPRSPDDQPGGLVLFWRFSCSGSYGANGAFPIPCTCINFRLDNAIHKTFRQRGTEEDR